MDARGIPDHLGIRAHQDVVAPAFQLLTFRTVYDFIIFPVISNPHNRFYSFQDSVFKVQLIIAQVDLIRQWTDQKECGILGADGRHSGGMMRKDQKWSEKDDHSKCNGRYLPHPGREDEKALNELDGPGEIEVLVDNETAVKM